MKHLLKTAADLMSGMVPDDQDEVEALLLEAGLDPKQIEREVLELVAEARTPAGIQVSYSPEMKQMLKEMSKDDLRTLSGQLEYLIRQEHERRQAPCTLVDTPAPYRAEVEG